VEHRIENLQYGLHSPLWVLGKDVHIPGVTPPHRSIYSVTLPNRDSVDWWPIHGEAVVTSSRSGLWFTTRRERWSSLWLHRDQRLHCVSLVRLRAASTLSWRLCPVQPRTTGGATRSGGTYPTFWKYCSLNPPWTAIL